MTRLHPFTLLALAAGVTAFAWIFPAPDGPLVTAGLALGAAAAAGPRAVLRPALVTAAPFWVFLLVLHDVPTAVAIGLRLTTMIAAFLALTAVLPPGRLVEAMVARGWPATTAFLLAATLNAVPVLRARARRIVDAQRCRGLATRGGPAARLRALRALALPLVLSALHEVDERSLALETRGLAPGVRRTPLDPPPDRAWERALRWAVALGAVAAAVGRLA